MLQFFVYNFSFLLLRNQRPNQSKAIGCRGSVTVLAWVPRNLWFYKRGFKNPWIIQDFARVIPLKCDVSDVIDIVIEVQWHIGQMLHFFSFCGSNNRSCSFWSPWIENNNAATERLHLHLSKFGNRRIAFVLISI